MLNTSVSCFRNGTYTFPAVSDLEAGNLIYKYYVLPNLSGSFVRYCLLKKERWPNIMQTTFSLFGEVCIGSLFLLSATESKCVSVMP